MDISGCYWPGFVREGTERKKIRRDESRREIKIPTDDKREENGLSLGSRSEDHLQEQRWRLLSLAVPWSPGTKIYCQWVDHH